jgi:hypothetical protein
MKTIGIVGGIAWSSSIVYYGSSTNWSPSGWVMAADSVGDEDCTAISDEMTEHDH